MNAFLLQSQHSRVCECCIWYVKLRHQHPDMFVRSLNTSWFSVHSNYSSFGCDWIFRSSYRLLIFFLTFALSDIIELGLPDFYIFPILPPDICSLECRQKFPFVDTPMTILAPARKLTASLKFTHYLIECHEKIVPGGRRLTLSPVSTWLRDVIVGSVMIYLGVSNFGFSFTSSSFSSFSFSSY